MMGRGWEWVQPQHLIYKYTLSKAILKLETVMTSLHSSLNPLHQNPLDCVNRLTLRCASREILQKHILNC